VRPAVLDAPAPRAVGRLVDRRWSALLAGGVPLAVLAVAGGLAPVGPASVATAVVGALLAVVALRHPSRAGLVGIAMVAVVPVYYGRYVVGSLALTPALATCLALLPAALRRARGLALCPLDVAVAAYVVCRTTSYAVNYGSAAAAVGPVLGIALPYAVFRLLAQDRWLVAGLPPVLLGVAALLGLVALCERAGVPNPFFDLVRPEYQAEQLARASERLGGVRAEAGFGDPIAFGMFLVVALVLGAHLALTALEPGRRLAALAACAPVAAGLVATQSRGPLVAGALGVVAVLLLSARRAGLVRVTAVVGAAVGLVTATPLLAQLQLLVARSSGDTREARSAEYRLQVLAVVREPDQFSLLGKGTDLADAGVTAALSARVGLKSLDSELASVYLNAGLLSLLALLAVLALLLAAALGGRARGVHQILAVGLSAALLNLLTVALFTQTADLVWIATALVASGWVARPPADGAAGRGARP
jgi:hypothetical protein